MAGQLEQAIERAVKTITDTSRVKQILIGTAVEITNTSCTVLRDDAPELFDVRLNAIDDDLQNYITIIPRNKSRVLVGIIENQQTEAVLLRCSEIEKVILKIGSTELEINENGYSIGRSAENLQAILLDLITEITKIIVVHGTSPNIPALNNISERIKKLLNNGT